MYWSRIPIWARPLLGLAIVGIIGATALVPINPAVAWFSLTAGFLSLVVYVVTSGVVAMRGNAVAPVPPGWYADQSVPCLRWWDGSTWTQHTAPLRGR